MKKNVVLSDSREIPLLHFLWKWKVSTTAALIQKFFPHCKAKTAYNRILALRQSGLIRIRSDGLGQKFVCTLDQTGFEAIREQLPHLKEEGYKSERIGHDLLVSAFHLGNWLVEKPRDAAHFSEQELRRTDPDYFPDWVPKTDIHRPDGYSLIPRGEELHTYAYEVELHSKRDADYARVADFYEHFQNIKRVLWLVPRKSTAELLNEKLMAPLRSNYSPHCFILLEEFRTLGWESRIYVGPEQDKPLSKLFSEVPPTSARSLPDLSPVQALLDTRKSPHISTIYRGYQFGDFSD